MKFEITQYSMKTHFSNVSVQLNLKSMRQCFPSDSLTSLKPGQTEFVSSVQNMRVPVGASGWEQPDQVFVSDLAEGGGGDKRTIGRSPFVTVSLWLEGAGGGFDPQRALLSPLQALLQTRRCILRDTYRHTHKLKLWTVTRGWAGLCEEMRWSGKKGLMASER